MNFEFSKKLGLAKISLFSLTKHKILIFSYFIILQEFCQWPDENFEEMDSTLVVQQYIQQLIRKDPSNVEKLLTMPDGQDDGVWKYEHLR